MSTFGTNLPPSTSILTEFLSFLYTPYGVAILAILAIVVTSLVWSVGCCVYCCCRYKHNLQDNDYLETNRDLAFYTVTDATADQVGFSGHTVHNETLSSGYNTGPPVSTTSLILMGNTHGI